MDNSEYRGVITPLVEKLDQLNAKAIEIGKSIIGSTLLLVDLGFVSLLNRSVQLTDGFISMVKERNLTCAGALLRLQLDNCMRTYALYIAADRKEFIEALMSDKKIDDLKDKCGNAMKDWYLKSELNKFDAQFSTVYRNASGYTHFSGKAFYQAVSAKNDNGIEFQVSHAFPEKVNPILVECVQAYIHFLKFFYWLIEGAVDAKADFESKQQGEV